jgi:carboxyl-terminal processing protease
LRGNPGGLLDAAVAIASEFLDGSVILIERFGDGTEQVYRAKQGGLATDIPLVVLVNAGSASASEIVAGAIQDHGRGILVGETTFGKGSVQTWHELSDKGAVRVTIARWYTPEGRQIHGTGLEPDVELVVDPETLEEDEDPQLEKAIEILLEMTQ